MTTKLKLKEGIYLGVNPKDYFALTTARTEEGVEYTIPSKSLLSKYSQNPKGWKLDPTFKKTPAMTGGSLLDCMLLTPQNLEQEFVMKPAAAPRRPAAHLDEGKPVSPTAKKTLEAVRWWRDFERKCKGKEVISADQMEEARLGVKQIKSHRVASNILLGAQTQAVCIVEHKGFYLKGMFDIIPDKDGEYGDCLVDLKRASQFDPQGFLGTIRKFKYNVQAYIYLMLHEKTTGEKRDRFLFMVSNSSSPFDCGVMEMHQDDIKRGEDTFNIWMEAYMHSVKNNEWNGPYDMGQTIPILQAFNPNF